MKTRTLNGAWTLEIPGTPFAAVPATVPGSVYHDLLAAERIPDPFYRDNEMEALKLMDNDFVYFRSFQVDDALLAGDKVLLRAEGLDTIAAVHINGQIVGEACNMHRIWEFDVKSVLHPGENTITVSFRSPTKYIKEAYAKSVADGSSDAMVGFPNIRKAHCMFGWDWGPRLPDAGIWRIQLAEEPYAKVSLISPQEYVGNIMELCQNRRGEFKDMVYLDASRVELHYEMPLNEIIYDFFDALKSRTRGYGSLDYELIGYRPSRLVKLDILLNGDVVDALSFILFADNAYPRARKICEKLKENIPRAHWPLRKCSMPLCPVKAVVSAPVNITPKLR